MAASRSLGSLVISLIAQTAGFEDGMSRAAKTAEKRSKEIEASAKRLGKEIGLAFSAIGGVAIAGMAKYVRNTIEAEKSQAQLASRIRDTAGAAQRSIEQLNAQADALQAATTFDDEAIGSVQAMLLTFKQIEGVNFDKATAAVLDLSTAMGTDLNSAALQLGKALNDPVKGLSALSRAGVQFSADQKKLIKDMVETGDVAGAQRVILAELEGQMGTAAEAARNTLGGALQGLQNNFDNLLEGDTNGAGLKGTVEAVNALSDSLTDPELKRGIDTLAGGLLRAGAAALEATAGVGKFLSNWQKIMADAGFAPGGELDQLIKRREKLNESLNTVVGRLFPDRVRQEIKDVDAQIKAMQVTTLDTVSVIGRVPALASGGGKGSAKVGGKTPRTRELPNFAEEDRRALEEQIQLVAQANQTFDSLAATMAGPLAEAEFQHKQNLVEIAELGRVAGKSSEEVAALKAEEVERYNEQTDAIRSQLTPYQELIEGLKEEAEYLKANTAEQLRLTAARLAGKGATDQQIEDVRKLLEVRDEFAAQSAYFEEVGDSFGDAFYDLATGAKEAEDALGSLLDSIFRESVNSLADFLSDSVTDFLKSFQGTGSSGQGGWGDFFSALGGIFGGGMANGGWAAANTVYEYNERGFETATVNGRQFMLTGNSPVRITPNHMLGGGAINQVNNLNVQGRVTRQTEERLAQLTGREAQRALARTG